MRQILGVFLAAAVASSGCSMVFQSHIQEPAPVAVGPEVSCSDSNILPVIDTLIGVAAIAVGSAGLYYAWGKDHDGYVLPAGAVLVGGTITLGSARSGYGWASTCRERRVPGLGLASK